MSDTHPERQKGTSEDVSSSGSPSAPASTQTPQVPASAVREPPVSAPSASASAPAPVPVTNHFSCINCRRRKIKCNKLDPCTNCTKAQLTCVFPPPRRSAKDGQPDVAILAKIERLKNKISSLKLLVNEKDTQLKRQSEQLLAQSSEGQGRERAHDSIPSTQLRSPAATEPLGTIVVRPETTAVACPSISPANSTSTQSTTDWSAGKLIKDEGRSIYVGGTFWAVLNAPEAQADDLADYDDDGDESYQGEDGSVSRASTAESPLSDFPIQSCSSAKVHKHPSIESRQKLWMIFKENVDPIFKVLHLPTVEPQILMWLSRQETTGVPKNLNALIFAVYFSAASSVDEDVCRELFGFERDSLVAKYRVAEENALSAAGFMNTDDLVVMQSLILYLATLRHTAPRRSWTLCPLAFRLLQSFGAHRDGASLNLVTYESEMHKRLCWHLLVLECAAGEDSGCDPTLIEISSFNALPPLNLNDSDLSAAMDVEPEDRTGWTDSTLLVVLADICQLWRLFYDFRRDPRDKAKPLSAMTSAEKREFLQATIQRFDDRYVKICSPLVPIQWVTATLARLLILEFKIAAHKPLEHHADLSLSECDDFLNDAVECLELTNKLLVDRRSVRWVWLFRTFTDWHALAFVLTELAARPLRKGRERAWSITEQIMVSRWNSPHSRAGHQWRSMLSLLATAQAARGREVRRRRVSSRSRGDASSRGRSSLSLPSEKAMGQDADPNLGVQRQLAPQAELDTGQPAQQLMAPAWMDAMLQHAYNPFHDSNMPVFDPPMGGMLGSVDDMDVLGDFGFDSDRMGIDTSQHNFLDRDFEIHDGFVGELC